LSHIQHLVYQTTYDTKAKAEKPKVGALPIPSLEDFQKFPTKLVSLKQDSLPKEKFKFKPHRGGIG